MNWNVLQAMQEAAEHAVELSQLRLEQTELWLASLGLTK